MKTRGAVAGLVLLSAMTACGTNSGDGADMPNGYVRAMLPASESGIQYANLDTPEKLPLGPSGVFSVRGGYAVSDNVGGNVVVLRDDFTVSRKIDVRQNARGITAITSQGDDILALDGFSETPRLLRISLAGDIESAEIQMNSVAGPTGIATDDLGTIVEYDGGDTLYRVQMQGSSIQLMPTDSRVWNGVSYSVDKPVGTYFHERTVRIGSNSGLVRVPNQLGAVQIIGPDSSGGAYVLVEDVTLTQSVSVEQSVWHFSSSGEALSVAKVPLAESLTYVAQGVALDKGGEPFALVSKTEGLQFWGLTATNPSAIFGRKTSLLPNETKNGLETVRQPLITYNGSCLSSSQMQSNAQEYLNVSQYMSSTNINNGASCSSRTKPNYLGSPGTYTSVSYDWGGWDTPSAFQSAMNGGGNAGNTNTAASLSCSYGVDCSGFLTRVWGFTDWKRGTVDIPNTNTSKGPAYGPGYFVGDAFNKVGVHTVLYQGPGSNGLYIWEAAGEPYARVVSRFTGWSYLSGYYSWRSLTSCN